MFNLFFYFDSFFLILLFYKKIKIKWSLIITKSSKIKFKNQIKKYKILYNLSSILFEKTVRPCGVKESTQAILNNIKTKTKGIVMKSTLPSYGIMHFLLHF
jgi:hypothetical protein